MSAGVLLLAAAVVSLNGEWNLKYWPQPPTGAVRTLAVPAHQAVKATVPGNCELDLVRAGVLPEMEVGLNVRKLRPYEGFQWLYEKTFEAAAVPADGSKAELVFGGIDTLADVFLNGEKVGESENMLIERRFDVTGRLRPGANTVQVLIRSAFLESQQMDLGELGYHMGFADNEPFRKAAHMGGWDIFPRVYCAGLWRDVALVVSDPVRFGNVAWLFSVTNAKEGRAAAKVQFRVQGPMDAFVSGNEVRIRLARNGKAICDTRRPLDSVHNSFRLGDVRADLWWPRGMGEPALYDATLEVVTKDGRTLARDVRKVGIRSIELERDDVYGPDRPGQFLFRVNGEPCYVRGSNWVPLDSFHSRDVRHLIPTLEMFEDLNCNMIRVWGGGVYEPDAFFDWCDAHGLMVWQDFMTGCSTFPQDDRFAKLQEEEVRHVVMRFRNHPSVAIWSGNNENDGAFKWSSLPGQARNPNLDRNSRKTIPDVLFEYDVTRPYLPSSPYEPPDVVSGKAKPSEMHLWGARGYYKVPFYTNSPCWFASEMGYHGCPNFASLQRMMTPPALYPWKNPDEKDCTKLDWNDEWRFKASNPFLSKYVLWARNDLMTKQAKIMFGDVSRDLKTFVEQSQFIQAEAMKTFCELFRSRKFTRMNGLIWWNVRDGWPQISDAVVDYWGGKKRAYFALRNAQLDQIVCLVDDHTAWAVNDARRPVKGSAKFVDAASGKTLLETSFEIPSNGKLALGKVPFAGQGVVKIEATLDGKPYRNHFLYGEPPFDWTKVKSWME